MRGHDIAPRAARRIRTDHRETALDMFHNGLLRDGVHDDIVEDDQLAQLEDAIATAENARDRRRSDLEADHDPAAGIADALDPLQEAARKRVMEICAERARTVIVDGDDWIDNGWEDADAVAAAQREAATWLVANSEVTKRTFGGMIEAVQEADA